MLFLVTGVVVGDDVGMQGFSDPQREVLDADSVTGHLLPAGSVFGFLAEHRLTLFPAEMFTDLFPSGRGRPSVAPDVVASVLVLQGIIFVAVLASDAMYGRIGFLKGKS